MMSTIYKLLFLLLIVAVLNACAVSGASKGQTFVGQLMLFEDKAPDKKPSLTRFLLTDRFVRVDENFDGASEKGSAQYVIYDRRLRIFYFINRVERSMREVRVESVGRVSEKPKWQVTSEPSQAVIRSSEDSSPQATYYRFALDGKPCYQLVALGPSNSEAYYALRDFRIAWGRYLNGFSANTPAMQDACYRAVFADDAETVLSYGFPTREWSDKGQQRFLVDFRQNIVFSPDLFDVNAW